MPSTLQHHSDDVVYSISDRGGDRVLVEIAPLADGLATMRVTLGDGSAVVVEGRPPRTGRALAALLDYARRAAAGDTSVRWAS